jgi:hypothetical protein
MPRRSKVVRPFATKPGLHGPLYRHEIVYAGVHDYPDGTYEQHTCRLWAYDRQHAEEIFYSGPDEGWEIVSIHRVRERS